MTWNHCCNQIAFARLTKRLTLKKEWTCRDLQNQRTVDQLPPLGRNCSGTCYSWTNGVMGDASPCQHSLLAIICGCWPSQLSEVSLSLFPEDAHIGGWKFWGSSEVPVWVPCNQMQQPILGWPWLWSCDRTDTNALIKKARESDVRSGMSEHQTAIWTISSTVSIQGLTTNSYNRWTT